MTGNPDEYTRIGGSGDEPASVIDAAGADGDDRTIITPPPVLGAGHQPVQPGVLINNNYRVQQMISLGGMGEVYRAENVFTGDPVALKIVLPSLAQDDGIVDLFMREARILGQLNDTAIVRYHNFIFDQDLGRFCLIMEFIDGTTLWDHVDAHGPVGSSDALGLIARLAEGLAKAHARGVTHRDLSPDNVMLRGDDLAQSVLIDFGIARAADMGEGALAGRFAGKFKYIAPEQLGHFGGDVGPRADIYGMALMIAAVLRGQPLDMGASAEDAATARRTIPDLSGLPHQVWPLLQYMLEPDPGARPDSMAEVAAMARDPLRIPLRYRHPLWGAGASQAGDMAESVAPVPVVPFARRGWWWPVALTAGVAALAVGGWLALRSPTLTPVPDVPPAAAAAPQLPGRDPLSRDGFLAGYDLPPCTQVQRIISGLDAGKLAALADGARDYDALLAGYDAAFSARPAVVARTVAPAQCPAVNFARILQGRAEMPPVLSLDSEWLTAGGTMAGRLRETRGRPVWLFLVAADGGVHDLSSRLQPQADGSFTFDFGMTGTAGPPAPQLIVALASRDPLLVAATTPDGAGSADLLPRALDEIARAGGFAAADIGYFRLEPAAVTP